MKRGWNFMDKKLLEEKEKDFRREFKRMVSRFECSHGVKVKAEVEFRIIQDK